MATNTRLAQHSPRNPLRSRRTGSVRTLAWLRDHPGGVRLPCQQAVDAISNSPEFPRH